MDQVGCAQPLTQVLRYDCDIGTGSVKEVAI